MFLLPPLWSHLIDPVTLRSTQSITQVTENSDYTLIQVELPGAQAEHLKVELNDDELSIKLTPPAESDDHDGELLWQEFNLEPVSLRYHVPRSYDRDGLSATLRDGLLTVELKKSVPEVKIIEINTGSPQVLS